MGLFDGLQFNPQNYGGDLQGLLSRLLPQSQVGAMPTNGFPQQDSAALPANSTPTQGLLPQPAPMPTQEAGFGDRLLAGLGGFQQGGKGGGLIGALTGGLQGALTGAGQQNQTVAALTARGLEPVLAQQIARDPSMMRAMLPHLMAPQGQTDDIKEYQFAKKEDPGLTFAKFMQQKKSVTGEYSLTPQYATDANGNTVLVQTGKSGEAIQTKLPEGVKVSSGTDKIDLGTQWAIINKRDGSVIGYQPKDVAGKASQEVQGEARGKAIVSLPTVLNNAEQSLGLIDEMIKHPGRETATGLSGTLDPRNYLGGTDAKNYQVRLRQIESRTFLDAFDQLRGAGAITEAEGSKATAAKARLDSAQSDEEHLAALKELQGILKKGMDMARQKAGVAPAAVSAPASAAVSVDDLVKKYAR